MEFLVSAEGFVFLEVNPRIQVEHTVTEEVTGVDLVAVQLAIACGVPFAELDLPEGITASGASTSGSPAAARGIAIQARVNMETMHPDGRVLPAAGTLTAFTPPSRPGVRVDTFGRPGLTPSPRYDSLLAKVITHRGGLRRRGTQGGGCTRGLRDRGLRDEPSSDAGDLVGQRFRSGLVHTGWLGEQIADLAAAPEPGPPMDTDEETVRAHLGGVVIEVAANDAQVPAGGQLVVLEAMKMQHALPAPADVQVVADLVTVGQTVGAGEPLVRVRPVATGTLAQAPTVDLDAARLDVAEIRDRHANTLDAV